MTRGPEWARGQARVLLHELGVKGPPVPIEKIVKSRGLLLQYAPLDKELSGMAFIKNGVGIIGVNALHHPNRQRFSIAHELAHHVLHEREIAVAVHVDKEFRVLHRDAVSSQGIDAIEIEANAFASEFLIPEEFLKDALGDAGIDIEDEKRIEELARKFRVSAAAMLHRLARSY